MAVHAFDFLAPVPRPECPQDEVRSIRRRIQGKRIDAAMLADPVPDLHMIRVCVFGESSRLGLLGGEETLLLLSEFEKPPRRFTVRLCHNTILQLFGHSINWHGVEGLALGRDHSSGKVMVYERQRYAFTQRDPRHSGAALVPSRKQPCRVEKIAPTGKVFHRPEAYFQILQFVTRARRL